MRRSVFGLAVAGVSVALVACGGGDGGDAQVADTGGTGTAAVAAPAGGGTITGTVAFTGTAPANPPIDMSEESACAQKYQGQPTDNQVVVTDGMLADVVVYVKSGLPAGQNFQVPPQAVEIDQDGCLYKPRALAMMVNQKLTIKNSDPVAHNIKAVPKENRGFNISQPRPMTSERTFSQPEMTVPFECNIHSWMHADVAVLPHPFFATTGRDGTFTITGLPAGTYEVEAWHGKLGAKTMTVTVPEGGQGSASFTFGTAT